jgi:chromosome segregation ATPase
LAQRDSEQVHAHESFTSDPIESQIDHAAVDRRIEELSEEANRAEERASMLEEMLHAAEDSSRNEQEERAQLEGWVSDIETRIGQREEEHVAEIEALKQRLDEAQHEQDQLRRRLGQAAHGGNAPKQYEETLEKLQHTNRQLQEKLAESEKGRLSLQQRLDDASSQHDRAMREERANIAKEQARISRLRFELSRKVADVESMPKDDRGQDDEASQKIKALRQHLREIHEQEKKDAPETTLTTRLAKLWKRVEY